MFTNIGYQHSTKMECLKGLSNDFIETIIVGVQEHRALWDKGMKDYRDSELKDTFWVQIAEMVSLPGRPRPITCV